MAMVNKVSIVIVFFIIWSCSSNSLNKENYIKWVESERNGLTKRHIERGLEYIITYCPVDYMIAKEFKCREVSKATYEKRKKDLLGFEYFKLRIQNSDSKEEVLLHGLSNQQEYTERVDYLSYGFDENLFIVRNDFKDTVPAALYHFERTYGVAPYIDFIISFKEDSSLKDKRIQFLLNDNVFSNSIVSRDYKKDFTDTPTLKLN